MKKVTYVCDKCKKELNKDKIHVVNVSIKGANSGHSNIATAKDVHICSECVVECGMMTDTSYASVNKNNPTMQEIIVDLLVDLGVKFEE